MKHYPVIIIIMAFVVTLLAVIILTINCHHHPSEVGAGMSSAPAFTIDECLAAIEQEESKGDANALGDWTEWVKVDYAEWAFNHVLPEFQFSIGHSKGYFIKEARAVGAYQICKIYVDDANRIMKLYSDHWQPAVDDGRIGKVVPVVLHGEDIYQFTYDDRWDRDKSRAMTTIVTRHYAQIDWKNKQIDMMGYLETVARTHRNPTERNKESTKPYWIRVKARMEKMRIVE